MGIADVKQTGEHELTLEWESSASNDMVADSTLALITGIDKSPASAKRKCVSFESSSLLPFLPVILLVLQVYIDATLVTSGDLDLGIAVTRYLNADN